MLIQNDFRRRTKTNGLHMRLNLGGGGCGGWEWALKEFWVGCAAGNPDP